MTTEPATGTPGAEPNEEEVVSGFLPFTINGEKRLVPELKWRANREWQHRLETFPGALDNFLTPDGQRAQGDAERELVLAYDSTHALGDLEDATEREIHDIYERLVVVSFPLASSPTAVAAEMGFLRGVESARANSTSGPSLTGTSAVPTTLRPRSRSARSSSSTGRRRSA